MIGRYKKAIILGSLIALLGTLHGSGISSILSSRSVATGTVTNKRKFAAEYRMEYHLSYSFTVNGQTYFGHDTMPRFDYYRLERGHSIDVAYQPSNPYRLYYFNDRHQTVGTLIALAGLTIIACFGLAPYLRDKDSLDPDSF